MKYAVITVKVYVNCEAVPLCDIKIGSRWSVSSASVPGTFCLYGKCCQHSLNMRLNGHQTYNGNSIAMCGDQQVKLNTLI